MAARPGRGAGGAGRPSRPGPPSAVPGENDAHNTFYMNAGPAVSEDAEGVRNGGAFQFVKALVVSILSLLIER